MSMSFGCKCEERRKPVADRLWFVIMRGCNYSKFNGSRYTPSDYSEVQCARCLDRGRTKAAYVDHLKSLDDPAKLFALNRELNAGGQAP